MSAHTDAWTLRAVYQHRGIPANVLADATFNRFIAWEIWFVLW
jgi:hypothetical protein